jgi:hypothetical protein
VDGAPEFWSPQLVNVVPLLIMIINYSISPNRLSLVDLYIITMQIKRLNYRFYYVTINNQSNTVNTTSIMINTLINYMYYVVLIIHNMIIVLPINVWSLPLSYSNHNIHG